MTNEELKKKISQIISEYCCPFGKTHKQLYGDDRMCYSKMNFAECNPITECTDALIAAGIGDVKEAKFESDHYWRMWQGALVELERAIHRAEVAERALYKACKDIKDICEYLVKFGGTGVITIKSYAPEQSEPSAYIDRAEKELAEEEK